MGGFFLPQTKTAPNHVEESTGLGAGISERSRRCATSSQLAIGDP